MSSLRFQYQTIAFGKSDIHLQTIPNKPKYSDDNNIAEKLGVSSDNLSLLGVYGDSSKVLENYMFDYKVGK